MQQGKVKRFFDEKGFGFITPNDGGKDVFVHHTNIIGTGRKTLIEGQEVEFDIQPGPKGLQAILVKPLTKTKRATSSAAPLR